MVKVYFTFGSDPAYPYGREDYVMALGRTVQDCINAYNRKYPPRETDSKVINCADYYLQERWDRVKEMYFKDREPKEVLVSDTLYGEKPEGFEPVWFWVPLQSALIYMQEGTGDNLLPEDEKEGYVDYIDYTCFDIDSGDISEGNGGQMMMTVPVQEKYGCLADAIPDILDFEYNKMTMDAQILKQWTRWAGKGGE